MGSRLLYCATAAAALLLLGPLATHCAAQGIDVEVTAYGTPTGLPPAAVAETVFCAHATPGQQVEFNLRVPGGANQLALFAVGLSSLSFPLPPGQILVDPLFTFVEPLDAGGAARFTRPLPSVPGGTLFIQAIAIDPVNPNALFVFSRGLEIDIVPARVASTDFDADTALTLLDLAWRAYEYPSNDPAANGRYGPVYPGRMLPNGFQVIREIQTPQPNLPWFQSIGWPETYAFIAQNAQCDVAVVFRGTDFTSVQDWATDIVFPQVNGFHGGILAAYLSVEAQIAQTLATSVRPHTRVYFTGHSLGGGLAPIAARSLATALVNQGVVREDIVLYSFAGPRAMSPARAAELGTLVPHHFAVVNKDDLVTHVPVSIPFGDQFAHIPRMRVLYPRRAMIAEAGTDYSPALLGGLIPGPLPHFQNEYHQRLSTILPAPRVWLSVSSTGYMQLNWSFPSRAAWGFANDFVALYRGAPDLQNPNGHLLNQWQWASSSGSYVTNTPKGRNFHIGYVQQYAPTGEQKLLATGGPYVSATPRVWLTNSGGWAQLNWSTPDPGAYDYVALYDRNPWTAGPTGYLLGQWHWATQGRSWVSWRRGTSGYWIAYIEDDNLLGSGQVVAVAGPY